MSEKTFGIGRKRKIICIAVWGLIAFFPFLIISDQSNQPVSVTIKEIKDNTTKYEGKKVSLNDTVATYGMPEPWKELTEAGIATTLWSIMDKSKEEICVVGYLPASYPIPQPVNITATVKVLNEYPYLMSPEVADNRNITTNSVEQNRSMLWNFRNFEDRFSSNLLSKIPLFVKKEVREKWKRP